MEVPQLEARNMKALSLFLTRLEQETLSAIIIRKTKINKVLKYIIRRDVIPREHELHIKERAASLLEGMEAIIHEEAIVPTSTGNKEPGTTEKNQSQPSRATQDRSHRPEDKVERLSTPPSHQVERAIQPSVIDLTEVGDSESSSRACQVQDLQEDKAIPPLSESLML